MVDFDTAGVELPLGDAVAGGGVCDGDDFEAVCGEEVATDAVGGGGSHGDEGAAGACKAPVGGVVGEAHNVGIGHIANGGGGGVLLEVDFSEE